jgi:hypothetical protein
MERQLEDAVSVRVAYDAVRGDGRDSRVVCPTGSDGELANAVRVGNPGWGLRGEALVDVVVAVEHDVGVGGVQLLP